MAKLAMPYVHGPGGAAGQGSSEVPVEGPWSTLELATHISHILNIAYCEVQTRELAAKGWDVKTRGLPYDRSDWPRFHACLKQILDLCGGEDDLDRPGISD